MNLKAVICAGLLVIGMSNRANAASPEVEVKALLEKVDALWYGSKSHAEVRMMVKTARYTRQMDLEYWIKGDRFTLIRINAPAKERGTATLKVGSDIFNYLPKIDRTVKISQALLSGAWMGSHFTNDDLTRSSRLSKDFAARLTKEEKAKEDAIWTIELTPNDKVALPYSQIVLVINKTTVQPISQSFFDSSKTMIRTVTYHDLKELGGALVPSVIRVEPVAAAGEMTELTYMKINRDVDLPDEFFSLAKIKTL